MSYRAPAKAPLTDWGRFIVRRRAELAWSATRAFEAVRDGLNLGPKSRSAYLAFEYDREPTEQEAAVFREVFGGEPGPEDRGQIAPSNDLLSELRETNRLLRLLVEQQTRIGDGQLAWGTALAGIAGLVPGLRQIAETPAASTPRSPDANSPAGRAVR